MESQDIRDAGLKVTLPRVKVLEILESAAGQHMSAEDLYRTLLEKGEDIGLATVYRVLTQFEGAGLVIRHHFEGGHSVFELAQPEHHDHLVCVKCGRVDEFVNDKIEALQSEIASQAGFEMIDHHLYIYGVCADCQKNSR